MNKRKQNGIKKWKQYPAIKRAGLFFFVWICILIFGYLFTKQDAFLYQQSIVKITHVTQQPNSDGTKTDPDIWQEITATVQNGTYKGEPVIFHNTYTKSQIASEAYRKNDQLFVKISKSKDGKLKIKVIDVKRDTYVLFLFAFMVLSLVFLAKKQGFLTLLSLFANLFIFFLCFQGMRKNIFFLYAWIVLSVAFCLITLVFTSGFHKKTWGAVLSSLCSVAIMALLYQISIYQNQQIPYELMPKMVVTLPLKDIYRTSVMIGLLGAVMDVSITVQATVEQLLVVKPDLSLKELISSIQEIGYDVMGTMVNILFFSYIGSSLPLLIIKVYHEYNLSAIFQDTLIFDAGRFLIGAIGLVIAIPISGFFSVLLFFKFRRKKQ